MVNGAHVRDISHGMFVVIRKRVPGLAELNHDAVVIGEVAHPIRLVFLVLSPVGRRAEEHLKSLAIIAQLTSDGVFTGVLEQQTSREKLLARLVDRA